MTWWGQGAHVQSILCPLEHKFYLDYYTDLCVAHNYARVSVGQSFKATNVKHSQVFINLVLLATTFIDVAVFAR